MAIITKKVGRKSYLYFSSRLGNKVIHKYLGPADSPGLAQKISAFREMTSVPQELRPLFWDARPEDVHLKRNAAYIIERVLESGGLEALNWLQRVYPVQKILQVIASSRALSERSRNFWRIWFDFENL